MNKRRSIGLSGENFVSQYLEENGYEIITKNFNSKFGEVDIIAISDDNYLCFIEVKTRSKYKYPQEAITDKKLLRMKLTANYFMKIQKWKGDIRFEVVAVRKTKNRLEIAEHITNIWLDGHLRG